MAKLPVMKKIAAGERINTGGPTLVELQAEVSLLKMNQAAEWVDPKTIKTSEPFVSLWTIKNDIKKTLIESMKEEGFDSKQPVIVWESESQGLVLLDGHTRRIAAIEAGIEKIAVVTKKFDSEDEAFVYASSLQINRRNITDADLLQFVIKHKNRKIPGKGKRAERIASMFDISETKAKNTITVANRATEHEKTEILQGKKAINKVYQKVKEPVINSSDGVNIDPISNNIGNQKNEIILSNESKSVQNVVNLLNLWISKSGIEYKSGVDQTLLALKMENFITNEIYNVISSQLQDKSNV
jgi:hypothetical protein